MSRSDQILLTGILAICAALCCGVDFFYFPATTSFPDELRILNSGITLASSGELRVGSDRAFDMPGPAAFYAFCHWVGGTGREVIVARLFQAAMLLLQIVLAARLSMLVFRRPAAALIAAGLSAIYPFFIFYQGLLLSETLFNLAIVAAFTLLYRWRETGAGINGWLVTTSLVFGLTAFVRPTLTILPPLLLAFSAWLWSKDIKRAAGVLLVSMGVYAAVLSPWWVRNYQVLGTFVPFATSSSWNLYLGNNAFNTRGGVDWGNDADPAVVRQAASAGEIDRQKIFIGSALDWIKSHPDKFLDLAIKKFARFWNVFPNAAEYSSGLLSWISALSFGPILGFAIVCALIPGLWLRLAPIMVLIAYFTVLHSATIASLRYRLPLEQFLIIMAAYPLAVLWKRLIETLKVSQPSSKLS